MHGGKRDGSGRPKGTTGIKHKPATSKAVTVTREVIREEIAARRTDGPMPALEVMRENMMYFRSVGEAMLRKCEEAHNAGDQAVAIDFLNEKNRMVALTQKCAAEIAPYEVPKLSATMPLEPADVAKDVTPDSGDRLAHLTQRFRGKLEVIDGGQTKKKA